MISNRLQPSAHLKTGKLIDEAALPKEAVSYVDDRSPQNTRTRGKKISGDSFNVSAGPPSK